MVGGGRVEAGRGACLIYGWPRAGTGTQLALHSAPAQATAAASYPAGGEREGGNRPPAP